MFDRHGSFVTAGAVIEHGGVVKSGKLWGGNPGKKLRELSSEEKARLRLQAEKVRLFCQVCSKKKEY